MQGKRILVVGYGKLGQRIAHDLSEKHDVTALKRSLIARVDHVSLSFADVTNAESLNLALSKSVPEGVDYLIYCLSPSERSEQGYREAYLIGLQNVMSCLPKLETLQHVLFISSTSVYHQENGEEVDEHSPCLPTSFSGKVLLEAESYLANLPLRSTVIRFSGIYGAGRNRLIDQVKHALKTGEMLVAGPGYTNRIHEDDCVGFICHLIRLLDSGQQLEACYVATDSCPIEQMKVYQFIATELQRSEEYKQTAALKTLETDASKSGRRAGSKQCINKCMKKTAYALKFESYKNGYLDSLSGC